MQDTNDEWTTAHCKTYGTNTIDQNLERDLRMLGCIDRLHAYIRPALAEILGQAWKSLTLRSVSQCVETAETRVGLHKEGQSKEQFVSISIAFELAFVKNPSCRIAWVNKGSMLNGCNLAPSADGFLRYTALQMVLVLFIGAKLVHVDARDCVGLCNHYLIYKQYPILNLVWVVFFCTWRPL